MKTTEKAYAKINLFLNVESKRSDGFHDIRTVMQEISLHDTLDFECTVSNKTEIELFSNSPSLRDTHDNLITKAARRYLEQIGRCARLKITLDKQIPIAAGLAGGSADAAATLRALNRLFGSCLTFAQLLSVAATLGSDVPFCLVGGTALCLGRGELISPIPFDKRLNILLAKSDEEVSTPRAYAALDAKYSDFKAENDEYIPYFDSLNAFLTGESDKIPVLYNIFESVVLDRCEKAREIKENMLASGADAALMSGSGPTVFGIFEDQAALERAKLALECRGVKTFVVTSNES